MNAAIDGVLAELWDRCRSWRDPLTMTVEAVADGETATIRELAARSRRTQEQMRRVAYQQHRERA